MNPESRRTTPVIVLIALIGSALACNVPGSGASPVPPTAPAEITAGPLPAPTETGIPPTLLPTESPTRTPSMVVVTPNDQTVLFDPMTGNSTPIAPPGAAPGFGPHGLIGVAGSYTYFASSYGTSDGMPRVQEFTVSGGRVLDFIVEDTMGLAVWSSGGTQPPRIAWGVATFGPLTTAELNIANLDGAEQRLAAELESEEGWYLVPYRWSANGATLFYTQEPTGLGGYILFSGISSLYAYDMASGQSRTLIPYEEGNTICIDDLSPDAARAALSCGDITVRDLTSGSSVVIAPPQGIEFIQQGGALFSPDGSRMAYGLARGEPGNEQGWAAISDDLATSRVIATAEPGFYFTPVMWVDSDTLILEQDWENPSLWIVDVDSGAPPTKLIDGRFVLAVP